MAQKNHEQRQERESRASERGGCGELRPRPTAMVRGVIPCVEESS